MSGTHFRDTDVGKGGNIYRSNISYTTEYKQRGKIALCMGVMTLSIFGDTLLNVMVVAREYHQRTVTKQHTMAQGTSFFARSVLVLRLLIVWIRNSPWLSNCHLPNSRESQT